MIAIPELIIVLGVFALVGAYVWFINRLLRNA